MPILTDGNPHTITIDVASAEADHTTLQNWFVSGLLQVVRDNSPHRTVGKITKYTADPFAQSTIKGEVGESGDVNITVTASRNIHIEADIVSGSGKSTHVVWTQNLQYSNVQNYLRDTTIQVGGHTDFTDFTHLSQNVFQTATGGSSSTHNGVISVVDTFAYPLNINLTLLTPSGNNCMSTPVLTSAGSLLTVSSVTASFDHSYNRDLLPSPLIVRSNIQERQLASEFRVQLVTLYRSLTFLKAGFFQLAPTGNSGNGTNSNILIYADAAGNTYRREVNAVLNNITFDKESGSLAPTTQARLTPVQVISGSAGQARLPGGRQWG